MTSDSNNASRLGEAMTGAGGASQPVGTQKGVPKAKETVPAKGNQNAPPILTLVPFKYRMADDPMQNIQKADDEKLIKVSVLEMVILDVRARKNVPDKSFLEHNYDWALVELMSALLDEDMSGSYCYCC